MNTTGLILSGILLAVLVAVSAGAMETQTRLETLNQALTQQRDELISLTQEANAQMDASQAKLAHTEDQLMVAQEALNQAVAKNAEVTRQRDELKGQIAQISQSLEAQKQLVQTLNARLADSDRQLAQQPNPGNLIPITGSDLKETKNQIALGIALAGMLVLGSGGVFVYTHSPKKIVTVQMTREQLKDYIRYQRERVTVA